MHLTTQTSSTSPQPEPLRESWVEKLFEQMLHTYGKKFTDQWGGADADPLIAHWSRQLAGYTGPELARGLAALETRDWPPTLPEFKKMCRAPIDPVVAFYEAEAGMLARAAGRPGEWSHPAIFWAAHQLGQAIGEQPYGQLRVRWERALEDWLARPKWPPIPAVAVALPAPGRTQMEAAVAKERINELRADGVLKTGPAPGRGRDWARKLLERDAAGDRSMSIHSLKLAKEVMGQR